MTKLTHIKDKHINMVDISRKNISTRIAKARAIVQFKESSFNEIISKGSPKGEILSTARIAGIQAAKNTYQLIPLCHNIILDKISISFELIKDKFQIVVLSECISNQKTGVEMESLIAANIASLTIYDMCKSIDKSITIENLKLVYKSGGKSGIYKND